MPNFTFDMYGGFPYTSQASPTTAAAVVLLQKNRRSILFVNRGTVDVYLGTDTSLTTSTGFLLRPSESAQFYMTDPSTKYSSNAAWYAITSTGTGLLCILESV